MRALRAPSRCLARRNLTFVSSSSSNRHYSSIIDAAPPPPPPPPPPPSAHQSDLFARSTSSPKPVIDIKHIRQNPELHEKNCLARNYRSQAAYPARIISLHDEWQDRQRQGRSLRERANLLRREITNPTSTQRDGDGDARQDSVAAQLHTLSREELLDLARGVKNELADIEDAEARLKAEIEMLATAIPNLTSPETPEGDRPTVLTYINSHPDSPSISTASSSSSSPDSSSSHASSSDRVWRSHVHIGTELDLLDFSGAATASGWGWYYLINEAAQLEQALIQYALSSASRAGWSPVSPPSMVYAHVAAACGFQPRDQNGETQVYSVAQDPADTARGVPPRVLTGTAEIPLAAMKAEASIPAESLPLKRAAQSRCYRAEAGARGANTKGLYRVHEFSKVELFAWTAPDAEQATEVFEEMVDLQTDILHSLGLHCRVLEMPTTDLGASAARKIDVEAFFPSRRGLSGGGGDDGDEGGWGEVTSASICTDYQTRRLGTRTKLSGKATWPWTINGTALAVPRVLAAILENGWSEADMSVTIPECLRPWMGGQEKISAKHRLR